MKLHRINLVMVSMIARKLKDCVPVFADVGEWSNVSVLRVRANPGNRIYAQVEIEGCPGWHDASAVFTLEPVEGDE